MSFSAARKTNFYNVILNTNHFAEVVTFRRHGQPDRPLTVIYTPTANERNDQPGPIVGGGEEKVETCQVRVGRDESFPVKSGIATPTIGDSIVRAGDPRAFSFQGQISESTPFSWTLIFTRRVPELVGARRQ